MKRRRRKNGKGKIVPVIAVILALAASFLMEYTGQWDVIIDTVNNDELVMTYSDDVILDAYFIDVGQGDCSLFVSDSMTMLIDGGEAKYADTLIETISDYGIDSLDYVVATHAHSDHIGALETVIEQITVSNIIVSEPCEDSSLTSTYLNFTNAAQNSDADIIVAEPSYTFSLGYADCTILAPFNVDSSNENNNSIVMLINAGETSFLLTGDAEQTVEKQLIENYPTLDIDILKVGHHGSSTSSYSTFIELISPEIAIIECGLNNKYGHPTDKTLETLDTFGVKYYRTDISGTISVQCTKDNYEIILEK